MTTKILEKIIKYLLYLLALTPLIITPFTIYPFVFGKGILMQLIIGIATICYLVLVLADKRYLFIKSNIIKVFFLFLLSLFISSFFGSDFNNSFWGSEQRFTGWFFLLHIFLFLIISSAILKNKEEWKKYLGFNVLVGIIMFLIAILSLFGVKFWGVDLGTRISGTLGNTLFLASYFILNLGITVYLFGESKNIKYKVFWAIAFLILFYGVLLTQSRGALLGFVSGLFFGLVYYGFFYKNKKIRLAIIGFIIFILVLSGGIYVFRDFDAIKNIGFLRRFTAESFTTANTRFLSWEIAGEAIINRPVLGWGVENFNIAFNKYYNPKLLLFSYYETWFDKPHNKILEIGVDGGSLAVILYLALFGITLKTISNYRKNGDISLFSSAGLSGVLIAYFMQNLFVFDSSTSYLLFALLLSLIVAIPNSKDNIEIKKIATKYLVVLILIIPIIFINLSPLYASIKLRQNTTLYDINQKINIDGYKKAIQCFNPYKEEWRTDLAKAVISSVRQKNNIYSLEEQGYALKELEKNIIEHNNDAYYHMLLGSFYGELANQSDYKDLAFKEFNKAIELSPDRQHIYFNIGRMYTVLSNREKIIETFEYAINLDSSVPVSYWEGAKQLFILDPNDEKASEWLIQALKLKFLPADEQEFLFVFNKTYQYFLASNDYEILGEFYGRLEKIEPNNPVWYAQNATVAFILKDYNTAITDINKAISLDESYRVEGEAFIEIIKAEMLK